MSIAVPRAGGRLWSNSLRPLRARRQAFSDGFPFFRPNRWTGCGSSLGDSTADTAGCSCEQIIDELALRPFRQFINRTFGCGPTIMNRWIQRINTFAFTLPAGSQGSVVVGPVHAGDGPLEVTLNFSGDFIILACVGTQSACIPMGGSPMTTSFNIPSDFPAGAIQARVYFNNNFTQPPGDASGTVSFVYNSL